MDSLFLYKYKPKNLNDFNISNENLYLLNKLIDIKNMRIIIIGDTGVGKTTFANILLQKFYNIDHIDNISNKDYIFNINNNKEQKNTAYRNELINFCKINHKIKKTIIIDDIDIINFSNQQIYKSIINKYKNKINFIFISKSKQNISQNILSSLYCFKINALTTDNIIKITRNIISKENIVIEPSALEYIISISNNNIGYIINYLETLKILNKSITYDICKSLCNVISFNILEEYTIACINKDYTKSVNIMININKDGYSVIDILYAYFEFIKYTNILNTENKYIIIKNIMKYITKFYLTRENYIDLALFTSNFINSINV